MNPKPPVALILDSTFPARLAENGLLPWWVQNVSGSDLAEVGIQVEVVGGVKGLDLHTAGLPRPGLRDGAVRRMSTPFKAIEPGQYALRVRIEVRHHAGPVSAWECPHEISLCVSSPDAKGQVNMVFNQPGLIKGYLPPGTYTFNAEVLVKPEGDATVTRSASPVGLQHQLPPADRCLSLVLEPMAVPGLGAGLDLEAFARHWQQSGRPMVDDLSFVDGQGQRRQGTACTGDTYRLRLQSFRGGCITLITQGSSGRFFQLAPHRHWGKQVAPPHAALMFPDDILNNLSLRSDGARPDPDWQTDMLPFAGQGTERALVVISPQPLVDEQEIFVGDDMVPRVMEASYIRSLLATIDTRSDLELGYTELKVQAA